MPIVIRNTNNIVLAINKMIVRHVVEQQLRPLQDILLADIFFIGAASVIIAFLKARLTVFFADAFFTVFLTGIMMLIKNIKGYSERSNPLC